MGELMQVSKYMCNVFNKYRALEGFNESSVYRRDLTQQDISFLTALRFIMVLCQLLARSIPRVIGLSGQSFIVECVHMVSHKLANSSFNIIKKYLEQANDPSRGKTWKHGCCASGTAKQETKFFLSSSVFVLPILGPDFLHKRI